MTKNKITILLLLLTAGVALSLAWFIYSGRCLKWAIDKNQPSVLSACLAIGAPVDADLGAYGNPLLHAVSIRNDAPIPILIRYGANPNQYPFRDLSLLAWGYSVAAGPEIGEALLRNGADVNAWAVPSSKKTILMYLLSSSELDVRKIRSVLRHKPNLSTANAKGVTGIDILKERRGDLELIGFTPEELDALVVSRPDQTRNEK
jgi:hypothetical protein